MAIAEINKVQIIGNANIKMDVLSSLQEEGIIQIEKTDYDALGLDTPFLEDTKLDHRLFQLSHTIDFLSQGEKKGLAEKILMKKPKLSKPERKKIIKSNYIPIIEKAESLEREKNDIISSNKYLSKEKALLKPFKNLDIPIKSLQLNGYTEFHLGTISLSEVENLRKIQEEKELWFSIIQQGKREVFLLIIYLKEKKEAFEESFKKISFIPYYFTESTIKRAGKSDTVNDIMRKIDEEIKQGENKVIQLDKEARALGLMHKEKLMLVYDGLLNERNKHRFSQLAGETKSIFYLEGWIQIKDIKRLKAKLKPYSESIEYFFRSPLPDETPPVVLENPSAIKPFEIVTKLYGLPAKGSLEPTIYFAPFFFVFLGLTVSDAGYGLLVTILSLLYLKIAKPRGGLRNFLILFAIVGVSNVIIGTMVGGWFGFPMRKLMVIDPLADPVPFLILSLVLGFIQVWFGTFLKMISYIKNKKYLDAFFVQGGWLILLPSLVLYLLLKKPVWGFMALAGASGIVFFASPSRNPISRFFGGLYNLYDISRYLADVLSYSRLLALGLATTVIAMVVNTLCQTALGIPWVGWLFAALIFIGGHIFNLAISFLGGFVHSMRLQFVEFFGKFFVLGGKPFEPFELENKYTELS
jgi:V/A-type H+-transporting ATPase subunit I